jgi:hypothetical protein
MKVNNGKLLDRNICYIEQMDTFTSAAIRNVKKSRNFRPEVSLLGHRLKGDTAGCVVFLHILIAAVR